MGGTRSAKHCKKGPGPKSRRQQDPFVGFCIGVNEIGSKVEKRKSLQENLQLAFYKHKQGMTNKTLISAQHKSFSKEAFEENVKGIDEGDVVEPMEMELNEGSTNDSITPEDCLVGNIYQNSSILDKCENHRAGLFSEQLSKENFDIGDSTIDSEDANTKKSSTLLPIDYESQTLMKMSAEDLDLVIAKCLRRLSEKDYGSLGRRLIRQNLLKFLANRYSYNLFLIGKLFDLFQLQILDVLETNEFQRPLVLRVNTLKTRRKDLLNRLIGRGVKVLQLEWSKVGLVVQSSKVPLGATPEYLAGHYILQSSSSFLPVLALSPGPDEVILDMCAAPGGKTTYIGQLMKNTGVIWANDVSGERCKAITGNAHRMGLSNVLVCCKDGRQLVKHRKNFDRVLLDAPCSGTGIISKDPSVKLSLNNKDIMENASLQKKLLLAAVDACKLGGVIVYSTCSILVEENEAVVDFALRRRRVEVVPSGLNLGTNGLTKLKGMKLSSSLSRSVRIYPHVQNMDGFYICKLRKTAN